MSLQKPDTSGTLLPPDLGHKGPKKRKIDLNALAKKVFQLLKEEARLENERQGIRRNK